MWGENCLSSAWVQVSLQAKKYKCIIWSVLIITALQHISPGGSVKDVYLYDEPTVTLSNAHTWNIQLIVEDFKKWYTSNAVDET